MKIKDEKMWQVWVDDNTDEYGRAVIEFAGRWADLMETALETGQTIPMCAKSTSHTADTDGITGFMYGAAIQVLSSCWEYGEELRKWHNLDVQIGDEGERANESGGVLNPAVLNIGEANES